jgi:hypothetical protein
MIAFCCGAPAGASDGTACQQRARVEGLVWTECANGSVWIIETTRKLGLFHSSRGVPTLRKRLAGRPGALLLVNGSYHNGDYARPRFEGLLRVGVRAVGAPKVDDLQLTHILSIDRSGRIASIQPASAITFAGLPHDRDHVQSGPLILDKGVVALGPISRSLNGSDAYKRTAIGRTREGETVIVVAKTPRSLADLGQLVAQANSLEERGLTLVNLDGGPSTGIHSDVVPKLSYGADKVTPVGFAVE